jgi:cell wall-associated NlpC family hydrolase
MKKITIAMAVWGSLASPPGLGNDIQAAPAESMETAGNPSSRYLDTARDVIFYALAMVGIHYRWGGVSPQTGFDCSGLVSHVFRQIAGLVLPRDSYAMARFGKPVTLDDLRPGDLVFFNTMRRPFSHVGIYLGERRFVHAPAAGKTVHVVDMTEPYWAARYNGARRIDL